MLSLIEQLSFKAPQYEPPRTRKRKPKTPAYKLNGYASRTAQKQTETTALYKAALSKRTWSSAKDLMQDLGLKHTACITKTMARDYLVQITERRKVTVPGQGGDFFQWKLKARATI